MREELREIAEELSGLLDGAKPVLLPMPYTRGHFRVYGEKELPQNDAFRAQRCGRNLFVTITEPRLLKALHKMNADPWPAEVHAQDSALDTLLVQILRHDFAADAMDCPYLARLTLDLDGDPVRCRRVIAQMEPVLRTEYADALRTGRKHSALSLIARQIVYYRWKHQTN